MKKILFSLELLIVSIFTLIQANILFEDSFDSGNNWANVQSGTPSYTTKVENGNLIVTAAVATDAYLKHTINCSKFTYSVTFKVNSSLNGLCGICFCWQSDFQGYVFSPLKNKLYTLVKWLKTGPTEFKTTPISTDRCSFVNEDEANVLTVVKNGSQISLFCNGVFLEKVTDTSFSSGDIGITAARSEIVSFDHAILTDGISEGQPLTYFSDSFDDNKIRGWLFLAGSPNTVVEGQGALTISTGEVQTLLYTTNGNYESVPCTTVVSYTGGEKTSLYGIGFFEVRPSSTSVNGYHFLINANRSYVVYSTADVSIENPVINTNIHGTTDTLIVTKEYDFYVNGVKMTHKPMTGSFRFNGAGIYVRNLVSGKTVSVSYDNFRVGNFNGIGIKQKPVAWNSSKTANAYVLGGVGLIYDIRGRQVATIKNSMRVEEQVKDLGAGSYVIITKGSKNHLLQRAIINVK